MARYFFHLHTDRVTLDEEGPELPDDSAAVEWAKREAGFQAGQSVKERAFLGLHHKLVVVNEAGDEVGSVKFGDVISVRE